MKLAQAQVIFLHGIAGSGMRGLAWLLLQQGKEIRGTDSQLPDDLPSDFSLAPEQEAQKLLAGVQLYIHTDAVTPDHPLHDLAVSQHIPVISYAEALGGLTQGFTTVAVAGTHGKSSTTAFLGHIAIEAGLDPTVLVGAAVPGWEGKHARFGKSSLYIVEADEYRNHFHTLAPTLGIITSIDFDHPDFFTTLTNVTASFQGFVSRITPDGSLIIPAALAEKNTITLPHNTVLVSPLEHAVSLPGKHMQMNAALAVAAAEQLGVSRKDALRYLQTFPSLGRRFETIGFIGATPVISDYAHHPAEITATIAAARDMFPGKRLGIIFEAHTAERLIAFTQDFVTALRASDGVLVYPPFIPKGRGQEVANAAALLEKELASTGHLIAALSHPEELGSYIQQLADQYDVILACTAGNLDSHLRKTVTGN